VRHGAHHLLDVGMAGQAFAHALHGLGQIAQLTGQLGRGQLVIALAQLDMLREMPQAAHRPDDPARHHHAHGE